MIRKEYIKCKKVDSSSIIRDIPELKERSGCYSGEITAWKSKGGHGRRNCKKCKERGGNDWDSSTAGQWSAGDTIKSKACSLGNSKFESKM